ncbi:TPA: hypothetical protein QDA91_004405 [Burkholderia vietnamiensis]|uniref:hypothetical protein n=1 Tax=Burkholderia vietnamiensis TaxID=60552 RepID=UPI000B09A532|nr:hypothetical protein [Burkholderia vietnamiensis]HDR9133260.1 hypothetical protein [Burkholderia vietnamiensis]
MSKLAEGLFELQRLSQQGCGALTEHLLWAVAADLIGAGWSCPAPRQLPANTTVLQPCSGEMDA